MTQDEKDHPSPAGEKLPVAVIGVGGFGGLLLQALARSAVARVVGVSDLDRASAERAGQAAGVPSFTDNRSLLAQTKPAAAYLAVPPAEAPALVGLCAERGVHVWKAPPLARSLEEGLGFVQRIERAKLRLAVGTERRFAAGYRRAHDRLGRLGELFLARAHYLFNWGTELGWRGDRASAGGGALLQLGYHLVDLLVWMLGLPEVVYGTSARVAGRQGAGPRGKLQPAYDTDDTAAAILRYDVPAALRPGVGAGGPAVGPVATLVTTRRSGPVSEELSLHGRGGSLVAGPDTCVLRGPEGEVLDSWSAPAPPLESFRLQAEAFARTVLGGGEQYECSGRENLLHLAIIDAIYLSDRTSQPEAPARLLQNHGLRAEACLALRPEEPARA